MRRLGLASLALVALAAVGSTACGTGYYVRHDALFSSAAGKTTTGAFVAGGGTISSTTSIGPYGPVSGVSVGPGGTTVYSGYGYGYGPYGYAPYGGYAPGYGTTSGCADATLCGTSFSMTRSGYGAAVVAPTGGAVIVVPRR